MLGRKLDGLDGLGVERLGLEGGCEWEIVLFMRDVYVG